MSPHRNAPRSYECTECGWQERVFLKANNKELSVQEVELILEAIDETDVGSREISTRILNS